MGNTAARQVAQHRLAQPHFRVALQQRYEAVESNVPRVRCSTNPSINRARLPPESLLHGVIPATMWTSKLGTNYSLDDI